MLEALKKCDEIQNRRNGVLEKLKLKSVSLHGGRG